MATARVSPEGKEFEFAAALALTGSFGKYQRNLAYKLLPLGISSMFCMNTIPYIMPAIVCDYSITKYEQGLLASAVFIGMLIGGFFSGLSSDLVGRRTTLIILTILTTLFEIIASFATNYWMLFSTKILVGFTTSGFLAAGFSYAVEFVDVKNWDKIILHFGSSAAWAVIIQSLLAAFIIPRARFTINSGQIEIDSWKIFNLCSAIMSFIAFLSIVSLLDHSPAFLLTKGRSDESLEILRKIYHINTGQPLDTYPVQKLAIPPDAQVESNLERLKRKWNLLLHPQYFLPATLVYLFHLLTMAAFNAIKLHQSMIFAIILGVGQTENSTITVPEFSNFCGLFPTQVIFQPNTDCEQGMVILNVKMYLFSSIVGVTILIRYYVFGFPGRKPNKLLFYGMGNIICTFCMMVFPFFHEITGLVVICIFFIFMQNCAILGIGLIVTRFPPSVRATATSLINIVGCIGAILGGQILPLSTDYPVTGCISSFWYICLIHLLTIPLLVIYAYTPNPFKETQKKLQEEAQGLLKIIKPN